MSLKVEVATLYRPMPGEQECGDRALSWSSGDRLLVAVIDGLGHGPFAALAAEAAVKFIEANRDLDLKPLFTGCSEALRATRGVVMTVIQVDRATGQAWHAAIGNVEARIHGSGDVPLITTPGVIGARMRTLRVRPFELRPGSTLIVHTDGISSRFPFERMLRRRATSVADELLRDYAKEHDDAGCAVLVS